jgi:hypothetical protein
MTTFGVTGAAGGSGCELCRRLAIVAFPQQSPPEELYSRSTNSIWQIQTLFDTLMVRSYPGNSLKMRLTSTLIPHILSAGSSMAANDRETRFDEI